MYVGGVALVKIRRPCLDQQEGTLHPPSDVCARSFLCPLFILIKLCYTKALE